MTTRAAAAPAPGRARIGVFGGAFDPPHCAHVALATAAVGQLGLDELRVFPTGQAWHKERGLSDAVHRLAMARLAFGELPRVTVDAREIERAGPTYTVETLRELQAEFPAAELVLIMGEDQAAALTRWHAWEEILERAIISVAVRGDISMNSKRFDAETLPTARTALLKMQPMDTSATKVRRRAAAGEPIDALVPDSVARYIARHSLYRTV